MKKTTQRPSVRPAGTQIKPFATTGSMVTSDHLVNHPEIGGGPPSQIEPEFVSGTVDRLTAQIEELIRLWEERKKLMRGEDQTTGGFQASLLCVDTTLLSQICEIALRTGIGSEHTLKWKKALDDLPWNKV